MVFPFDQGVPKQCRPWATRGQYRYRFCLGRFQKTVAERVHKFYRLTVELGNNMAYNIILTRPSSIRFSSPLQVSKQKHERQHDRNRPQMLARIAKRTGL